MQPENAGDHLLLVLIETKVCHDPALRDLVEDVERQGEQQEEADHEKNDETRMANEESMTKQRRINDGKLRRRVHFGLHSSFWFRHSEEEVFTPAAAPL
jgi:succinylglutamate desuccinylase